MEFGIKVYEPIVESTKFAISMVLIWTLNSHYWTAEQFRHFIGSWLQMYTPSRNSRISRTFEARTQKKSNCNLYYLRVGITMNVNKDRKVFRIRLKKRNIIKVKNKYSNYTKREWSKMLKFQLFNKVGIKKEMRKNTMQFWNNGKI